jgi:hypothetical protein
MVTQKFNIKKFSFSELCSNSDGKTSGSGTAGLYIVFIGGICFILGCIDKMFFGNTIDIVNQSIILIGIGATLLGYRKSKDSVLSSKIGSTDSNGELDSEVTQLNS